MKQTLIMLKIHENTPSMRYVFNTHHTKVVSHDFFRILRQIALLKTLEIRKYISIIIIILDLPKGAKWLLKGVN